MKKTAITTISEKCEAKVERQILLDDIRIAEKEIKDGKGISFNDAKKLLLKRFR